MLSTYLYVLVFLFLEATKGKSPFRGFSFDSQKGGLSFLISSYILIRIKNVDF